ncbi:uncharacterized mitochondrial protein AtMg00860-like [Gastrolobium bilobum]|uniref:uncharacterized mitochondrial protein AtMg00860-like n=1 Tax=Gastrolobium bilobum TaxID=150636 RepID=UPI002AAF2D36|nr:uncharacterized mitochondrial protein AtMg00860-like [Gastrolobium bilobum]
MELNIQGHNFVVDLLVIDLADLGIIVGTCESSEDLLECLKQNQFCVKLIKCAFAIDEIEYLGHLVSGEGVKVDPKKISTMTIWPTPSSVKQLRGFLRLIGHYRCFARNYASIVSPFSDLLKENAFSWSSVAEEAFVKLKDAISYTLILRLPNFS